MSNQNLHDYIFKFILIGETSKTNTDKILNLIKKLKKDVGKSALLMQFIYSRFKGEYDPTIGIEFGSKAIELNGYNLKLQIWDTVYKTKNIIYFSLGRTRIISFNYKILL